jgi:chromodomain-helicase-DNA-binding protein 7
LVIAPLSTIPHWQRELESWTDLNGVVFHGNYASRQMIKDIEFSHRDFENQERSGLGFEVLITTFDMIMIDVNYLKLIPWKFLIVDEAHRLKSKNSKTFNDLRQLKVGGMILMTGTPLQNNMGELFSLLHFLSPNDFYSEKDFLDRFGDVHIHTEKMEDLHKLLLPFLLRRMKDDVESTIPIKEETIVEVELTRLQKQYYKAIHEKNFKFLSQGVKTKNIPNLLNVMMELRKCCNHPFLIKGAEDSIVRQSNAQTQNNINTLLVLSSGKFVLLDKLLPRLLEEKHKVLIFSQMTKVLDLIQKYLKWKGYTYERIDGGVKSVDRQAAIDRFSKEGSHRFIFLLCTRAGGLGINLTSADTVIIFDSDWNPQNDIQAQARCHRIGFFHHFYKIYIYIYIIFYSFKDKRRMLQYIV